MGLLSRFRTSSISSSSTVTAAPVQNGESSSSSSNPIPKTPNPAPHSFLSPHPHPHPQSESPLRPSIPPPSPSANSVSSRISRKPWKRTKSNQPQPQPSPTTPIHTLRGKKEKEKGKGKADDVIGIAYEEMPQSPPKPTFSQRTASEPSTPQTQKRISMFHNSQAVSSSPLRSPTSPTSDRTINSTHTGTASKPSRPDSALFKQAGGVLGKLGFEVVESPKKEDDHEDTHEDLWLESISDTGHEDQMDSSPSGLPDLNLGSATSTISDAGESAVIIDKNDLTPDREVDPDVSATSVDVDEDGMETMETPEKKGKFWKGMGRPRRSSKAATDYAEVERSGSPTPRKTAVSDAHVDLIENQPRPPQLRRPSSSLFHNPFNRSVSRASTALDLDRSPVDNGSFQLRGFRHVSGMSEVEGAGGLDGYLSHVKKESTAFLPLESPTMSTPVLATDTSRPPSSYPLPKIHNSASSRPPSIAGSLASVDDLIASSNKVSVAAFRRGIRRPSEVFGTMSDLGHGGYSRDDDDDDDLPLGMLNRSGETSNSKSRSRSGDKSTTSLSSMRELAARDARPDRESSPSPALSFTVQRHHRSTSGAFLLKSAIYTRPDEYTRPTTPGAPRPAAFAAPPITDPPTPAGEAKPVPFSSPDVMNQQDILTPVDSYFAQTAPAFTASASKHAPTPLHELRPKPDFDQGAFPSSLPTALERNTPSPAPISSPEVLASPRRAAPPVEPIPLPQPGDKTPASLHLPLPPDQMPDTPPKHFHELLQRVPPPVPESQGQMQSGSGKKRLSLLDEPMRLISGFWAQSNQEDGQADDGFDPALVVDSMNVYGTTENLRSPSIQQSANVDEDRQIQHQPSRTTLFDMRTASPTPTPASVPVPAPAPAPAVREDGVRSPLSERLANVAISSLAKPSLTHLKASTTTLKDDKLPTVPGSASIMSPAAADARESTTIRKSPVIESASTLVSSFARAKQGKRSSSAESESDESESENEDELGVEAKRRIEHAQQKASLGLAPNTGGDNGGERRTSGRRIPGGPRKPSIRNRITSSGSTSIVSLQPLRGERRKSPPRNGNGQGEKEIFRSNGESDDDEPLARVRNKASRSSLSLNNISPPNTVNNLPIPMSPTSTISNNSSGTRGPGRNTLVQIGPVNQPLRDQSDDCISTIRGQRSFSTSTSISPPPIPSRSPKRAFKREQLSPTSNSKSRITITASPASSVSGTGTNYTNDSSLRLLTPRESVQEAKEREHIDLQRQRAKTPQPQSHSPWQTYPYPQHQPQRTSSMSPMPLPQLPMPMQSPMSMDLNGQMDPAAMHAMMKQQWQMQFMAAAYRASEEEWERASSVSGYDGPSSHHHQQRQQPQSYFPPQPPPNIFYPYVQPMPPMGLGTMGLGMGMGMPFFPGPGGQPLQPNMNVGGHTGVGGGMYSYGPTSQSVFGGEFGPPRVNAPSQLIHSSNTNTNTAGGERERARTSSITVSVSHDQTTSAGRSQIPSPPSSWRLSKHGMENVEPSSPPTPTTTATARNTRSRPQSTFIN